MDNRGDTMIDEKTLARVQEQLTAEKTARKKEQQRKAALKEKN